MSKRILLSLLTTLFVLATWLSVPGQSSNRSHLTGVPGSFYRGASFLNGSSEREQDGLNGPVRRVRTETAKLSNKNGKLVEGARVTLEVAAYDIKGAKIENAYYPVPGAAITGKEVYKYDDKGNIVEMILQDEKGTLLSKETYTYEFDQFGNWTRMTTSVAVIENGKITFEPTEVTYRTISYYLDEATLARMNQTPAPAATNTSVANTAASNSSLPNTVPANSTASNSNASAPASGAQVPSNTPLKTTAQNGGAANSPASTSKQPAQTVTANNKPVVTTTAADASRQSNPPTAAPPPNATPIVRTSAPVGEKPSTTSNEQARDAGESSSSSSNSKPAAGKPGEEQASKPIIKPLLKPISGGVLNGKAINLPKPAYPLTAKSARLSGVVVVEVVIDGNGKVISARAVSGPVLLQQAAVQAAYQAKFSPTMLSDQPVKVVGTINYNFALAQ
jgi:TonB family protein